MRRAILALAIGYVVLALVTRALEGTGMWYRCACQPDCWCKRSGLSLFRWVVPRWHKLSSETPSEGGSRG